MRMKPYNERYCSSGRKDGFACSVSITCARAPHVCAHVACALSLRACIAALKRRHPARPRVRQHRFRV